MEEGPDVNASGEAAAGTLPETENSRLNGSPERLPTSAAEATTPEAAKAPSSPLFPTPLQNKIAKVGAKESDPYFDQEIEGEDGEVLNLYKEVGTLTKAVSVDDVKRFISVTQDGADWTDAVKTNASERTNYLRTHVRSICPPHFAPAFDQDIKLPFLGSKTEKRGRKRKTNLVIGMSGYCSAKSCPTKFFCGFTEESIKSMLDDDPPATIELTVIVQDACCHEKGAAYGQLRGNERQGLIDELNNSKLKPGAFAKGKLTSMTDNEYHSGNRGVTTTRETAYNLSREGKAKALKESGFTDCKMQNVFIASDKAKEEDISARAAAGDRSKDLPGILRCFDLSDPFRVYMWTKTSCLVTYRLCKGGMFVLHMDATGGIIDFSLCQCKKGKILHTKVAVKPLYALVAAKHMRDKGVARKVAPLTIAEMASARNTAEDIKSFLGQFVHDVQQVAKDASVPIAPLLCMTDCSAALEAGALRAFTNGRDGMADTRILYGNVVLIHLLHYDFLTKGITSREMLKEPAVVVFEALKEEVPTFIKECSSHVCRAPPSWLKGKTKASFRIEKGRIENVFWTAFLSFIRKRHISVLIVKLSVLVALFETEKFVSPSFNETSEVKERRGDNELQSEKQAAEAIVEFIHDESERLHISSLEEVKQQLGADGIETTHIAYHEGIIDRAKSLMERSATVYLSATSVMNSDSSQTQGVLRVSVVYNIICDDLCKGDGLEAMKEGGINVSVLLPFNGRDGLTNPFYSPIIGAYLREEWMFKPAIWSRAIVTVLENALDMEIEDSNQLCEAVIKNAKHNQDAHECAHDPGLYTLSRFRDTEASMKQFMHQYGGLKLKVKALELHRENKRQRTLDTSTPSPPVPAASLPAVEDSMTQDEKKQQAEEQRGEIWSRKGSNTQSESLLRNDLEAIFLHFKDNIGGRKEGRGRSKQFEYIKECLDEQTAGNLMGYALFNQFMKGEHKSAKGLKHAHRSALQEFVRIKQEEMKRVGVALDEVQNVEEV